MADRKEQILAITSEVNKDSIAVLYKGGRLSSWHSLTSEQQQAYSQEHVDLMLSVAREHGLMRLEGFKLMAPQQAWERFWVIEFPTLAGAEAWIEAEMAPPYGSYGYYEYYLSRHWQRDRFSSWVTCLSDPVVVPADADPHRIQTLNVDDSSVIVLLFGCWRSGASEVPPLERGDDEHIALMQSVAREHGLMRLEAFRLIGPQYDWHRAWVIEFPTLAGAEAWIDAEVQPPHGRYSTKTYYLARKWAPEYFASWVR
jgi:hypothetical protein